MRRVLLPLLLFLGACSTLDSRPMFLSGEWGGPHVGLVLEGGLGKVEYDCASGTIDGAIAAGDGPFSASGTHRTGQGGPVRVGQIFHSQRATYQGEVAGDVMTFALRLEDGSTLGPFRLVRGAVPQITRCL